MAKEREVALWQEALKTGEQVHPLTEETLNKHMQGPIIIEDERNAQNVSHPLAPRYNVIADKVSHAACHKQCHIRTSNSVWQISPIVVSFLATA